MKKLYISESERIEILRKHNSKILSEQNQPVQTNYTIQDLQNALIKAGQNPGTADNQFGPKTMGAIEKAVGGATPTTAATATTATATTQGTPDITNIETKKVTGLVKAPTPSGLLAQTVNVNGSTDNKDKANKDKGDGGKVGPTRNSKTM